MVGPGAIHGRHSYRPASAERDAPELFAGERSARTAPLRDRCQPGRRQPRRLEPHPRPSDEIVTHFGSQEQFSRFDGRCSDSVLIAGGIGITLLLSMIRRLEFSRSFLGAVLLRRGPAAPATFLDELVGLQPVHCNRTSHVDFDDEPAGRMFDFGSIVKAAGASASVLLWPGADARGVRSGRGRSSRASSTSSTSRPGKTGTGGWLRGKAGRSSRTITVQVGTDDFGRAPEAGHSRRTTPAPRAFVAPARRGCWKEYRTIATCF